MTLVPRTVVQLFVGAALLAGCAHSHAPVEQGRVPSGDGTRVMMGHDGATVIERRHVPSSARTVRVPLSLGVSSSQLAVVVVGPGSLAATRPVTDAASGSMAEIEITRTGSGDIVVEGTYSTGRLNWRAVYDVSLQPGDAANIGRLQAAIEISDDASVSLRDVEVELFASALPPRAGSTDRAALRATRRLDLVPGRTRVALTSSPMPLTVRRVHIFDPLGASFDRTGRVPVPDENYGQLADLHGSGHDAAAAMVRDGYQVSNAQLAAVAPSLPGRLWLYQDDADGKVGLLGSTRVFDDDAPTAPTADLTIIAGPAEGVSGHRERTDFSFDSDHNRIIEEFTIALTNTGKTPTDVLVREHLYRGQNWTLAFHSDDAEVSKEGPQQIALSTHVGAGATTKLLYRVVYSW